MLDSICHMTIKLLKILQKQYSLNEIKLTCRKTTTLIVKQIILDGIQHNIIE